MAVVESFDGGGVISGGRDDDRWPFRTVVLLAGELYFQGALRRNVEGPIGGRGGGDVRIVLQSDAGVGDGAMRRGVDHGAVDAMRDDCRTDSDAGGEHDRGGD